MAKKGQTQEQQERLARLEALFWLADAPLFVDERLVERFFDAVVRPKYEHVGETDQRSDETEDKILAALGLKGSAGLKLPEWLKPIKLDVEAKGDITGEQKSIEKTTSISQLKPIWNAERQLEELTRHYLAHHRDRIVVGDAPLQDADWPKGKKWYSADPSYFTRVPRALAFLDLPLGTKLIPTAAEFTDGTISLLYEDLVRRLTGEKGGPMRRYPEDSAISVQELRKQRKQYWASFQQHYDSKHAMLVIEEASTKHGRIGWIDFRLPLDDEGTTLHLHIVPSGKADAGTFGYNFVRRAHKHGVRVVATLKSEPDMNVMAIYEK